MGVVVEAAVMLVLAIGRVTGATSFAGVAGSTSTDGQPSSVGSEAGSSDQSKELVFAAGVASFLGSAGVTFVGWTGSLGESVLTASFMDDGIPSALCFGGSDGFGPFKASSTC